VPLSVSTRKEDVIVLVVFGGVWGGLSGEDLNPRVSLVYRAKYRWFGYLKKMGRELWDSL
jgi:hypothetical protein